MIENNLLKSNFLGRDGFRWWIGQIPPATGWSLQFKRDPDAWGNRVKVRIMGYHPQNTTELSDKDLPWATVLLPTNHGSGKAGTKKKIRVTQGDVVVGFFMDGDDAQLPVIIGVIGNSQYAVNKEPPSPFVPFSGYTPETEPGSKTIVKNEVGGNTVAADSPVVSLDPEKAKTLTQQTGREYRSSSTAIGSCVPLAGTDASTEIKTELQNSIKDVKGATGQQRAKLLANKAKKITGIANSFTGDLTVSSAKTLGGVMNGGLNNLYNKVYGVTLAATQNTAIAKKAGTAAQAAMLGPVANLQKKLPCVIESVGNTMLPDVTSLLTSMLDNVTNFTPCIADQFSGAIFNKVISGIGDALGPELGGVGKILGGFDMISDLRGKAEGLLGIQEAIKCVAPGTANIKSSIWCLGKGPMNMPAVSGEAIMSIANAAQSLQEAAGAPGGIAQGLLGQFDFLNPNVSTEGFSSALGECYTGPPLNCKGMQVKVFGSDGEGTIAEPIVGALVGDALAQQTGSLIGIKLTNPGQGYTVPPLVEITDNCNQGYGANARAVIDYDPQSPTYQQVTDIYVVTPGENYPVIEENVGDKEYTVDHVVVISPGEDYKEDDVIQDNVGNVYDKILDANGKILNVIPPNPTIDNVIPVDGIPQLTIQSSTGFGAIIKPQIAPRPTYQGEIKQVIDCITPRDGIVGFVNGDPYYGPFHIHPTRGVKMVGAAHTTTPHAIIYDTPAESRTSSAGTGSVQPTMTTVASPTGTSYTPPEPTTTTPAPTTTPTPEPPSSPPPSTPPSSPPPSSPPSGGGGYGY